MKLVIMGCGRVGARLALMMDMEGHDVTVIDADPHALNRLSEEFGGKTVLGTGIDVDVLKSAGIETADAFAAVTNYDNTNIMACEVAKEIFGVKKVLARIYDPGRESLYHELGLETICPTTLLSITAQQILEAPEGVEILPFPPHTGPAQHGLAQHGSVTAMASTQQGGSSALPTQAQATAEPAVQPTHNQEGKEADGDNKTQQNGRGLRNIFRQH